MNNCTKKIYMGAKYIVTIPANPEWTNTTAYEPLTMVTTGSASTADYKVYISRQYVPVDIAITNQTYWSLFWEGDAAYDQLSAVVNDLSGSVDSLESQFETLNELVDNLNNVVSGNGQDISNLKTRMTTAEGDITTLEEQMSTATSNITSLQNNKADNSTVTALNTRLNGVDGGTTNTGDTIQEANTKISTLETKVANLPNVTYSSSIPTQTQNVTCSRLLRVNVEIGDSTYVYGWGSWSTPASSTDISLVFLPSGETSLAFTAIVESQTGTVSKTSTNSTNNGININVSDSQPNQIDVSFMCVLN